MLSKWATCFEYRQKSIPIFALPWITYLVQFETSMSLKTKLSYYFYCINYLILLNTQVLKMWSIMAYFKILILLQIKKYLGFMYNVLASNKICLLFVEEGLCLLSFLSQTFSSSFMRILYVLPNPPEKCKFLTVHFSVSCLLALQNT